MEEIRRSPVEVGSLSHCLQGFIHATGGCLGFLKHQMTIVFGPKRHCFEGFDLQKLRSFGAPGEN